MDGGDIGPDLGDRSLLSLVAYPTCRFYLQDLPAMNLQQLEYIVALERHKHFGKAAEYAGVSQPTLSTMVQKLEEELGVKLFDRTHQPILPTDIGCKVLAQAHTVLRQAAILMEIVQNEEDGLSGSITLGILPTIAPYLLPRLVPVLHRELPELHVNFVEKLTSECLADLESGQMDLAVLATLPEGSSRLEATPLFYEEFFGYVSRQEPLFAQNFIRSTEVDPSRLWLLDEGHCFRDQLSRFCQLRRSLNPQHQYRRGSLSTFMNMIEGGSGMTFIPELCVRMLGPEREVHVRPFAIPRPTRLVNLTRREDFGRRRLYERLVDCLRLAVPEEMLQLRPGQSLI